MYLTPIVKGIATFIPGINRFTTRGSGGSGSARYCYSVWMRHVRMLQKCGLDPRVRTVAELGPGDSLGTGLAALLSGVDRYYACDAKMFASPERNLQVLDELIDLFHKRSTIPGTDEFPGVRPRMTNYSFPGDIFDEELLKQSLAPDRIRAIRDDLRLLGQKRSTKHIFYMAPWSNPSVIQDGVIDLAFSQAVMEHVDDVLFTYKALWRWIRPGGFMSHVIDFRCHDTSNHWNGHWSYGDVTWKLIVGRRPFFLNRQPHSAHLQAMYEAGFEIIMDQVDNGGEGIPKHKLSRRFQALSDDDLRHSGAMIIARRLDDSMRFNPGV